MDLTTALPVLLATAWLLPLGSFALIVLFGPWMGRRGVGAGYLATGAIVVSFVLSLIALLGWLSHHPIADAGHHAAETVEHGHEAAASHAAPAEALKPVAGDWYALGRFGSLAITIGYYIDSLTLVMFTMVTLVASCIHFYSFGYMHEELGIVTDPLVRKANGRLLKRKGRFHRFYQYLSLFCFSMLGLVISGNVAMVFIFWELVGICSYLLIGFYIERKSASNAANKAFIVNRVGDFGMLIGLMVLWSTLGTFSFGGIFEQVRPADAGHELIVPDGMVHAAAADEIEQITLTAATPEEANQAIETATPGWRNAGYGQWLLIIAGLGIFCGCVGKSAQFPLHVWLPDAMEGPTPVSALIHAATMVAAGVYLVGRFYPVFTPEVLLVIAYVGCITLFMAATIAITATDIKRVLAYSTVSQLGYMMLSLGVGGWLAGLFHLITHAFFKSLLFLGSGSVIHACHTNEMPEMGGLRKKMPWTAYTMLTGCLAISGAGIPLLWGLSGFHSKDSILAQLFSFRIQNSVHGNILFWAAAGGAAITACYMFRLWYLTFAGKPRNEHVAQHAHESPAAMVAPLVILAVMAAIAGWKVPFTNVGVDTLIGQSRPVGTELGVGANTAVAVMPAERLSHEKPIHNTVSWIAFFTALAGFLVATVFYGVRRLDPDDVRKTFGPVYTFLCRKWYFDELYQLIFIRPVMVISRAVAAIDKHGLDWLADNSARFVKWISRLDEWIDRLLVDGLVNQIARQTHRLGLALRAVQTGNIRQYVMAIAFCTVTLFVVITLYWSYIMAAGS
ncbi:MAG: NADH-quinone oxidoreductase subunit L [Pirellulales bacterium]|nr:NADH-quinone oxidoreductase subunit L [Pirellulales bacterium]